MNGKYLKLIIIGLVFAIITGCATTNTSQQIPKLTELCMVTSDSKIYAEFRLTNNDTIPQRIWVDWGIYNQQGIENLISEPLEQTLHSIKTPAWPDPGLLDVDLSHPNVKWIDLFWNNSAIQDDELFGLRLRLEFLVSGVDAPQILFSDLYELGPNSRSENCPSEITPQLFFGSGCANTPGDSCNKDGSGIPGGG